MNRPATLPSSSGCAKAGAGDAMTMATTSALHIRLFPFVEREDHGLGPRDVDLVADLHLGECNLVLDARAVLPTVRTREGDRGDLRIDGGNRRGDRGLVRRGRGRGILGADGAAG